MSYGLPDRAELERWDERPPPPVSHVRAARAAGTLVIALVVMLTLATFLGW